MIDKKILVTGGNGFLGKHLVRLLKKQGHGIHVPGVNLADELSCISTFYDHGPFDAVYHLAAKCNGISDNVKNGPSYLFRNERIDLNVIECCKMFKIKRVIAIGSVCMYPDWPHLPIDEDLLFVNKPSPENYHYGMAKRNLWHLLESIADSSEIIFPVLSNLYGPGDHFQSENAHVIPSMIRKFYEEDEPTFWGDGSPTRDFLYVEDAAKILSSLHYGLGFLGIPFNVSPSKPITIQGLAQTIGWMMNKSIWHWDTDKPNGTMNRHYDNGRLLSCMDINFTNFEIGIKATVDDYGKTQKNTTGNRKRS